MKISMWIIASRLEAYEPLLSIKEGNANIEGVRIYDGDLSTFTTVFAYVGNAADIFSDASFAQTVLVVSGLDYILIPNQTVDTVLNELLDIIDCYNQWERRLLKVSGEENGLQQLIDLGEQMLDHPIHLVDLNGNILAEGEKCQNADIKKQWEEIYQDGTLSISHGVLPNSNQFDQLCDWIGRCKVFEMENGRTVSDKVTMFRAKREMLLVITMSTSPARQSANSRWKFSRLSLVPVRDSSAYTPTYFQPLWF